MHAFFIHDRSWCKISNQRQRDTRIGPYIDFSSLIHPSVDHYKDAAFRSENAGQVEEETNEEAKEKEAKDEVTFFTS
jgi:hypothetical protein